MVTPAQTPARIVYLEDDSRAFELVEALVHSDGFNCVMLHVEDADAYRSAISPAHPDLILADFNLPSIDGLTALAIKQELCPEVPFIFVSGSIGEDVAINSLRNGANDFVLKDALSRLPSAIRRAIQESREHSERMQAEIRLRESEERFRRLSENAPDVIFRFTINPSPKYDYISPAIERITGYKPDEFYADIGLTRKIVHPADKSVLDTAVSGFPLPEGNYEVRWIAKDGRTVVTEQRLVPIRNSEGVLIAVEGIARDITERKQSEERIRILSESIEQGSVSVVVTDPTNNIIFANRRACELSGYSLVEIMGKNPRIFASGKSPASLYEDLWAHLNSGRTWQGEFHNKRPDGAEYFTRAAVSPIFDERHSLTGYLSVQEDITAWKKELENRRKLEAQLFQAQKLETIGTLAGGIAHDFNNILTGILGYNELAANSLPAEHPLQEDLDEVRKAGLRAKDLVAQILTFSRKKESKLAPIDLGKAVDEALKLARASTPATVEIIKELTPGIVRADPTQIHQIVLNLCTNAVHAMKGRPGRLTVRVDLRSISAPTQVEIGQLDPGRYLCLVVKDTGKGMDEETITHIFDPFFTTKSAGEGTGLGLSLVQGIMCDCNGAIRLRSRVGEGTVFELFFPVCDETQKNIESQPPVQQGRGERIAIVDDENSISTFIAVRLEQLTYRVSVFNDPRAALEAITSAPDRFDVIITDYTMPHITGDDLIRKVRAAGIRIPAVITSGDTSAMLLANIAALGRVRVLPKPFTGDEIAQCLQLVLDPGLARAPEPAKGLTSQS